MMASLLDWRCAQALSAYTWYACSMTSMTYVNAEDQQTGAGTTMSKLGMADLGIATLNDMRDNAAMIASLDRKGRLSFPSISAPIWTHQVLRAMPSSELIPVRRNADSQNLQCLSSPMQIPVMAVNDRAIASESRGRSSTHITDLLNRRPAPGWTDRNAIHTSWCCSPTSRRPSRQQTLRPPW